MMTVAVGSTGCPPIGFNAIQQPCRGGSLLLRIVATQSSPTGIAGYIPEMYYHSTISNGWVVRLYQN